jgi:membrane fusion protein (multidrug efflux system)
MSATSQEQTPAAIPVVTAKAELKPIARSGEFVGRVDAINRVDVRARVVGFLESVDFKEGDDVKQGAVLYRIEKGLFQAAVDQAEGSLERTKAAKALTQIQLDRAATLLKQEAGSAEARDQAKAADQGADSALVVDQANLKTAQINLGYTDIVSPIAGKIGLTKITVGNVVGPDSGVLATIVSQDPMYVEFPVSQREFLRVQQENREVNVKEYKATLHFSDGSIYDQQGVINLVNVTVDRATDTVIVRATFPNPDKVLIDGQVVRVAVESTNAKQQVVVPQSALISDQEGVYLFVVEGGKAVTKRVKTAEDSGAGTVITEGLSGGEQVIVDGLQNVRPGIAVRASPASQTLNRS